MRIAVAAMVLGASAAAAPAPPAVPASAAVEAHALTAGDLGAWLDGMMPLALGRGDIAGAEIVVVSDGKVLFEKGYGFSDMKARRPVDPARTLFRPGSISKLFTWTAVMQLVERRKLDLDRDVNAYLDFRIPETFGKPVTLRNLMTHTAGFEETIKHLLAEDPQRLRSLGEGLKAWVPEQIFAPGSTPAYSNYGAALAGYIVQRVSGETFETYVERHIFSPLGMTHSTFVQPLPTRLAADMSAGYDTASGKPKPFELVWMSPAGALSTTADDMAKFMIAYLGGGGPILKPQTVALMQSEIYRRNPPLPGMGLGFYHEDTNGHVIVGHGGDTVAFHSDLHLIPDAHVGLFYSQNSAGKENSGIRGPLFRQFMDRYFPAPLRKEDPVLTSAHRDGSLISGYYENSRRSESSFFRLADTQSEVRLNDDDTISVDDIKDLNGEPRKWREVRPYVWREIGGPHLLIARVHNGAVEEIATDLYPQIWTYWPAPVRDSARWNLPLLMGTLAMLALVVLFWPIKAVLRWRYGAAFPYAGRAALVYRLTRIVALIDLVFLGGYLGALAYGSEHLVFFGDRSDGIFLGLQILGWLGILGAIVPVLEFRLALSDKSRPWWTRVTDGLIVIAALATVWFAFEYRLVNFHLNY